MDVGSTEGLMSISQLHFVNVHGRQEAALSEGVAGEQPRLLWRHGWFVLAAGTAGWFGSFSLVWSRAQLTVPRHALPLYDSK